MVGAVVKDFGALNILVNNAGLAKRQRFVETTPDDWHSQIDACLYGAIHCCHAAAPHLENAKNGRIISLIGDSSRVGESGLAIVAAARAGVVALMKSLAREFGRSGTTANAISLGLVETDHDKEWVEANREKLVKLYPVRRLGPGRRRRPDGRAAGVAGQRMDHRPGAQHQRRLHDGVTMLHADLIAPIPELLKRHARERGRKVAYRDAHSSVTYTQLEERTARLAAHLADHGIMPGDTVAILLPNSTQWVETCFAIARAGAIGVPISYDASEPEIAYRLEDANCRAIVTTGERGDLVAKLKANAPNLQTVIATNRGGTRTDALSYE